LISRPEHGTMFDMTLLERMTVEPDTCGGRPCIRGGVRIRVADVLGMLAEGVTHVPPDCPYLEPDDIRAALAYARAPRDCHMLWRELMRSTADGDSLMRDSTEVLHLNRVRHIRESFAAANERLVARLRAATDEAAAHSVTGGWTPAQIGWHVATVSTRFAGVISGDLAAAAALPDGYVEKPWAEIAASIPDRLQATEAIQPPAVVSRHDAIALLEASGVRMAQALDTLTFERGTTLGLTNRIVGTITLYQVGEWATAHIARHNRQAKRALGA
jgi:uncharacterized protein (DUF433 family)